MTMMKITPNAVVDDVLESARFWCDVLGYRFIVGVAEGSEDSVFELTGQPLGFAMIQADDTEVMFQSRDSISVDLPEFRGVAGDAGVLLFIEVDDVEALRDRVDDRATLVSDLRDTFYGMREFVIRDPSGLVVVFAQRLGEID
jgi:uncharacterized glyoxalase superfamily protein PhnB